MRLRKMDQDRDMQFGHNAADLWHDEIGGVAQSILTRLLLFRGEWFLDLQEGTPWGEIPFNDAVVAQGQILGPHTQNTRDAAIFDRVLTTPGVHSILDYASQGDPNLRTFSAQLVVDTVFGQIQVTASPAPERPYFVLNWSALGGADPL